MKNLRTLTVGQLKELLEDYDDDLQVIFTADYGDYHHTAQALPLSGGADVAAIAESAYSNSGFALVTDEEQDDEEYDGAAAFLVLR